MTFDAAPPPAPASPPAPAREPVLPPDARTGGLAFHRLVFARRRSGWWTPLVVGLLGLGLYAVMIGAVLVVVIVMAAINTGSADRLATAGARFDLADPLQVAVLLGSIALMLPAYVLASLIVNGPRTGLISSAAGRLRWKWMLRCGALAVATAVVLTGVSLLLPPDPSAQAGEVLEPAQNPWLLATLLVILLVVPVQAAAEEYVFRGYLQQSLGRWLRHPLFAILLPVPLFVLGHMYDPLGQAGVAVFAVAAGWLTWRTGGLEAAIAVHVVNNLLAFAMALAGLSDVNASSPGVVSFIWSALLVGVYVAGVEVLMRRTRLPRVLVLRDPEPAVQG
ncbi:type II CAAX endopeptidase family protein [Microbacterium lacus]|uniref:CPBP family intramembrane metalloprotease n=1 Tax=Microbacterium lacus TaxID=415217 RepID=A0ABN2H0M8_9MICO